MSISRVSIWISGIQELERFDPTLHLARLSQVYRALDENLQKRVTRDFASSSSPWCQGAEALQSGIAQFLNQFGHLSDSSSDFSQRALARESRPDFADDHGLHAPHKWRLASRPIGRFADSSPATALLHVDIQTGAAFPMVPGGDQFAVYLWLRPVSRPLSGLGPSLCATRLGCTGRGHLLPVHGRSSGDCQDGSAGA